MRVIPILLTLLLLSGCFDDDASTRFNPAQAIEGQWEVDRGFFIWDNGNRISSLNPLVDSLPSVQVQFTQNFNYKIQYAFFVTNGFDQDTITITNGVQEGTYELMVTEDRVLDYSGEVILTENITNTSDIAEIRYQFGSDSDSLWLQGVQLNNLLFGEISAVYFRNSQ